MATASMHNRDTFTGLDTTVRLVTPERIVFLYPLAGPFRRVQAYLIDVVLEIGIAAIILVLALMLSIGTNAGFGPALAGYFVLLWGYGIFWEGLFNGRTPGKRVLGLRVVTEDGLPITATQAVIRNTVGAVDGLLPFCYLTGLASMLLTDKFQRLGDLAAGTMVIVEEKTWRPSIERVDKEADVAAILPWVPVRFSAGPELARALADYVKVRKRLGKPRREEMAGHLARLLRQRYGLPDGNSSDAVLCAVYHRVFIGE